MSQLGPYELNSVIQGDCLEVMADIPDNSIDSIITDPPYGLGNDPDIAELLNHWLDDKDYDTGPGFMSKGWDVVPGPSVWRECFRVMKPGGCLLAFGGTRTVDLLSIAIRMAGFQKFDEIVWLHAQGFPKSTDISKKLDEMAIVDCPNCNGKGYVLPELPPYDDLVAEDPDNHISYEDWLYFQTPEGIIARQIKCFECDGTGKVKGAEREVIGRYKVTRDYTRNGKKGDMAISDGDVKSAILDITAPATDDAKTWGGYGTALKPAHEVILCFWKPREKSYADNALKWGVAGLWIDGARIATGEGVLCHGSSQQFNGAKGDYDNNGRQYQSSGRYPANVLITHAEGCVRVGEKQVRGSGPIIGEHPWAGRSGGIMGKKAPRVRNFEGYADPDGLETVEDWRCVESCPVRALDEMAGVRKSGGPSGKRNVNSNLFASGGKGVDLTGYGDSGSASRFFYTAKASGREKWFYCQVCGDAYPYADREGHAHGKPKGKRKHQIAHPTVKPQALLNYLCKLTKTPTGGIVLDPFAGSGTTGEACLKTGREFILIEKETEYKIIAERRIEKAMSEPKQLELLREDK